MRGVSVLFVGVHIQFSQDVRLSPALTLTDAGVNPTGHMFFLYPEVKIVIMLSSIYYKFGVVNCLPYDYFTFPSLHSF